MNMKDILILLLLSIPGLGAVGCSGGTESFVNNAVQFDLTGSRQGQSVGFVDVDEDGTDEKIVGAPYAAVSLRTGAVLVYKGTEAGYGSLPMMVMTGDDNFGFSFANVGDVDGDKKDDFVIGAINGSGDGASDPSLC